MDYTEEKLRRINRYEGIVVNVTMDCIRLPDGATAYREVVEHPGGVCVLPVDADGNAWCVRQFRYPSRRHLLEAPAGKLEPGEDPLSCAVRELSEETGFTAGRMVSLGSYYTSPGFSTERLYLYLALGLHPGKSHPDEGEFLNVEKIPFKKLTEMVMNDEIDDGKTIAAVLKAEKILASR